MLDIKVIIELNTIISNLTFPFILSEAEPPLAKAELSTYDVMKHSLTG